MEIGRFQLPQSAALSDADAILVYYQEAQWCYRSHRSDRLLDGGRPRNGGMPFRRNGGLLRGLTGRRNGCYNFFLLASCELNTGPRSMSVPFANILPIFCVANHAHRAI